MGIAPDKQLYLWISSYFFQFLKINSKIVIVLQQRCLYILHIVVFCCMLEIPIGRCVNNNFFILGNQQFHQLIQSRNNASRKCKLFLGKAPVIHSLAPSGKGIVIIILEHHSITENSPVQPGLYTIYNGLWCGKFHISNPHPHKFLILVWEHLFRSRMKNIAPKPIGI